MSENQQVENKNETNHPVSLQQTKESNEEVKSNILQLPTGNPKHTVQDDITNLNQEIQKKRLSQRKSVFSNHDDQNLTELIQNHNNSSEKQSNNDQDNGLLKLNGNYLQNNDHQVSVNQENTDSNHQENENENTTLPQKPSHTAQDDIKRLTAQIDQRKSFRRPSQFATPSLTQLNNKNNHATEVKQKVEEDTDKQDLKSEGDEDNSDEDDDNKILSLKNLEKKQNQITSSHQMVQTEEDVEEVEIVEKSQQKSIQELEEEAKKKPNSLNQIIKLNTEIQHKKELKRKSTFSVPIIEEEEDQVAKEKDSSQLKEGEVINEASAQEENGEQIKKKPNAYNEVIKLNNEIQQKRDLKRKSTFSMPVIDDDNEDEKVKEDKLKSVQFNGENQIHEEPALEDKEDLTLNEKGDVSLDDKINNNFVDKGNNIDAILLDAQKKPNAFNEIVVLNNKIKVQKSLSRKSTFSVAQKHDDDISDEDENKQPPQNTINFNQQEEGVQPQQKKPNAYDEIISLNNKIQQKQQLSRKSTFQAHKDDEDEDENEEENNQKDKESEEQGTKLVEVKEETDAIVAKKPNAYNEIINLNNEIQHKRDLKRKSTFSMSAIHHDENDEDDHQKQHLNKDKGTQEVIPEVPESEKVEGIVEKKLNAYNEIIDLNNQIQQKRDIKRKSTFSIPVIEDDDIDADQNQKEKKSKQKYEEQIKEEEEENETEEARFLRQKKKKNLMDYKEEQIFSQLIKNQLFTQLTKKDEKDELTNEKRMIFKDQNKSHYRKVIHHPADRHMKQDKKLKAEVIVKQKSNGGEQDELLNSVKEEGQEVLAKSADCSFKADPQVIDDTQLADKIQNKPKKPVISERRNEFALQRKLEYLTAQSAKNELHRKEKDKLPHNKFIAQELTKEIRIREANKKKRELEAMLAQINREIQFIRISDPDYESLIQNNQQNKIIQEDKQKPGLYQNGNDPLNGGGSLYSNSDKKKNLKNNEVILPAIKKNNQIKEMIKIAEDQQAKQEALVLMQKMRREKLMKRQKKDDEFNQVNDQILKEVEIRRLQNENLHEKIMLEKRQKLIHKKQQYENKKEEQQKLVMASKNFVKDLRQIGAGKVSNMYLNQVNTIDSEHKYGQYQTPELDAHKIGLQQIRNLAKGEYSGGGSLPRFMKGKERDNSEMNKLLEENQINHDVEVKITENRKYLYNKRMEYSKSVKNHLLRGGKKDIGQNLFFQDDKFFKNNSLASIHGSQPDSKRKKQIDMRISQATQKQQDGDYNEEYQEQYEQQNPMDQQGEEFQSVNTSPQKNSNDNNVKMWRVKQKNK